MQYLQCADSIQCKLIHLARGRRMRYVIILLVKSIWVRLAEAVLEMHFCVFVTAISHQRILPSWAFVQVLLEYLYQKY
jgi:hypothetical protein